MLTMQQIENAKQVLKTIDGREFLFLGIYNAIMHVYDALNELRDRRLAEIAETERRKGAANAMSSQGIIDNSPTEIDQLSVCPRQAFGQEGPTHAERKAIEDAGLACPVPYLQPQDPPQ